MTDIYTGTIAPGWTADQEKEEHATRTPTKGKGFRLQVKNLFCTWPQCSTPKETVLDRIKLLPSYEYAIVCREDHKDDHGEHLHAFIHFNRQVNKTGFKWLDDLADSHGNYRAARNNLRSVRYIMKDGDIVFHGFEPVRFIASLESHKNTRVSKATVIATMIREKDLTIHQLDDFDPGWVLANKRKAEEYICFVQQKKAKATLAPWPGVKPEDFEEEHDILIATWLLENIRTPRVFKQKQLYVHSNGPDVGKTTLIENLSKFLCTFVIPKTPYVDGYISNFFDLIVCDEFNSHFTIQFLNEFLQGSKMHLNQKGTGTMKLDNPPMIILSNKSPEQCFHKRVGTGPFNALLSRLLVIEVPLDRKINVLYDV